MSLTRRKLVVLAIIGAIFLLANALIVAGWLQRMFQPRVAV